MSFRKLAAAEGLVVHLPFLYECTSSLLKAAAPPVLIPPNHLIAKTLRIDLFADPTAGDIDLPQIFPT